MTKKSRIAMVAVGLIGLEALRRRLQDSGGVAEAVRTAGDPRHLASDVSGETGPETGRDTVGDTVRNLVGGTEANPAHAPGHRHLSPPPVEAPPQRASTRAERVWQPGRP
ncbi:MAG: hypothetical protein GX868_12735 [Actinobacteria bacterium]|nr:hypothetical protein [Actinomycetota bacterium]